MILYELDNKFYLYNKDTNDMTLLDCDCLGFNKCMFIATKDRLEYIHNNLQIIAESDDEDYLISIFLEKRADIGYIIRSYEEIKNTIRILENIKVSFLFNKTLNYFII